MNVKITVEISSGSILSKKEYVANITEGYEFPDFTPTLKDLMLATNYGYYDCLREEKLKLENKEK